jgi:hypothetical protein
MQGVPKFLGINDGGYLGKNVEVSPMSEMRITDKVRLVGAAFNGHLVGVTAGGVPDPNFWTVANTGTGTTTQPYGQAVLNTTVAGVGTTSLQSMRNARYVGGTSLMYRSQIRHDVVPTAPNIRRWGAYTTTNGSFFCFNGVTVQCVTRKTDGVGTTDVPVAQAAWNGQILTGNPITYDATDLKVHSYEIYWTNGTVYFVIDDKLVHKMSASAAPWTSDVCLPVRQEIDSSGGALAVNMFVRTATISRLGIPLTRPTYKHANANNAAIVVCKYGPGTWHGLTLNTVGAANNLLTIYDDITIVAGSVISVINTNNANLSGLSFPNGVDFTRGFGYVLNGGLTAADVTLVYE